MKSDEPKRRGAGEGLGYAALPLALEALASHLDRRVLRLVPGAAETASWVALAGTIRALGVQVPHRGVFEEAILACLACDYHRTEGFLGFIYQAMRGTLTEFAVAVLRRTRARDDVAMVAADLVAELFAEMAEALMDGACLGASTHLPPPGGVVPWLFRALRNDIADHCRSGINRLERTLDPVAEEDFEHTFERATRGREGLQAEAEAFSVIQAGARRDAFLMAFTRATSHLKPRHQEVLRLRELEDASIEEISVLLQKAPRQIADLLQYAREKRAQLLLGQVRQQPALAHLEERGEEILSLLQRVRLGCIAAGLRRMESVPGDIAVAGGHSPMGASGSNVGLEGAHAPLKGPWLGGHQGEGAGHARAVTGL